jgi:hypothetical protein
VRSKKALDILVHLPGHEAQRLVSQQAILSEFKQKNARKNGSQNPFLAGVFPLTFVDE